jgi:hypothetical protein
VRYHRDCRLFSDQLSPGSLRGALFSLFGILCKIVVDPRLVASLPLTFLRLCLHLVRKINIYVCGFIGKQDETQAL